MLQGYFDVRRNIWYSSVAFCRNYIYRERGRGGERERERERSHLVITLQYLYAIMLSSNWESVSLYFTKLIHFCKNYLLHLIANRANVLCKYIIHMFFNFGHGFCSSFSILFPKTPASCAKTFLKQFLLHCTSIFMSSKVCLRFFKCDIFSFFEFKVCTCSSGKKNNWSIIFFIIFFFVWW